MPGHQPTILRPAFVFDCPSCGAETFARAVPAEFSPEQRADAIAAGFPVEPGAAVTAPSVVECGRCGLLLDVDEEPTA